jgi:glycosyltransferase involved in cell wall biosynthesis
LSSSPAGFRVFLGPVEIAGIAQSLARGLAEQGIPAEIVLSIAHPFQYEKPSSSWWQRVWQRLGARRVALGRDRLVSKSLAVLAHHAWGWLVLLLVIPRFDAFVFLYGQTITNSRLELWLLRRLNRKILFIYAGSESRPPYMDGGMFPGMANDPLPPTSAVLAATRRCVRRVAEQERFADYIICSPTTAHFLQRPYINWFAMGFPKDLLDLPPSEQRAAGPLRVLHGPSNPLVKGSALIIEAIEQLIAEGCSIELITLQGVSHARVLEELARCDLVVDQLYSDTPLAGLATEAAFFGKPSVVAGYFAKDIEAYLAPGQIAPSLFVEPTALKSAIRSLIEDPEARRDLGLRAQRFVRENWSAGKVAERYLQLLQGRPQDDWWCDPGAIGYVAGCGMPLGRVQRLTGALVREYGTDALQLADKPALQAKLVALARDPGNA